MRHTLMNMPVVGTLGFIALLVGPIAKAPIVFGAWLLERYCNRC